VSYLICAARMWWWWCRNSVPCLICVRVLCLMSVCVWIVVVVVGCVGSGGCLILDVCVWCWYAMFDVRVCVVMVK